MPPLRSWTNKQLTEAIKKSTNMSEVINELNLKTKSGYYKSLKIYIEKLKLDTSHFTEEHYTKKAHYKKKTPSPRKTLKEILVENSDYMNTSVLKKKLIREGLIQNKCQMCGLGQFWNEKKLILQLDHIDGNNTNNKIENLRFLCPNCHSQTETYCRGRSRKPNTKYCKICNIQISPTSFYCIKCYAPTTKIKWPTPEEITKLVWEIPTQKLAEELGVSDKAIQKYCQKYNIQKPPRGYWRKLTVKPKLLIPKAETAIETETT
jgi:HNH endonuclease